MSLFERFRYCEISLQRGPTVCFVTRTSWSNTQTIAHRKRMNQTEKTNNTLITPINIKWRGASINNSCHSLPAIWQHFKHQHTKDKFCPVDNYHRYFSKKLAFHHIVFLCRWKLVIDVDKWLQGTYHAVHKFQRPYEDYVMLFPTSVQV